MFKISILFSLLVLCSVGHAQVTSAPKPATEIKVSYVQSTNLQTALKFLQEKYKFNYICDILPSDDIWKYPINIKEKTLNQSLQYLCLTFDRAMFNVNGILIFRGHDWRKYNTLNSVASLKEEMQLQVDCPEPTKTVLVSPARFVQVTAFNCSLGKLTKEISARTQWKIYASDEIERRKVNIQTQMVSPGAIAEAISVLVNAQQTISIIKTKAQLESEVAYEAELHLAPRELMSRELRPELEKLLTKEQKEKMLTEEVPIKISTLKEPLKQKVIDYVKFLANRPNQSISIDFSKIASSFEIVFLPPNQAPGGALGVNGQLSDGMAVGF